MTKTQANRLERIALERLQKIAATQSCDTHKDQLEACAQILNQVTQWRWSQEQPTGPPEEEV